VDADAELDASVLRHARVAASHPALHLDGETYRIDDALEFNQGAVSGGFDDAAAIFGDLGIEKGVAMRFEITQRAFLVGTHQPRIARDIGGEDGGKAAGGWHFSQRLRLSGKLTPKPVMTLAPAKRQHYRPQR
jgi:hypothetical protein